ncbi:hypothetical protein MMC28_003729 [Mycoblastus sanguinarius]|nr:hypothetical protein [Mycoblastus sanguinarius]
MDYVKSATGMGGDGQSNNNQQGQHTQSSGQSSTTGGMLGGIGDRISSALGGKQHSEDAVNKGGEGDQSHHAAVDQAHDKQIEDFIRDKYKSTTEEEDNGPRLG